MVTHIGEGAIEKSYGCEPGYYLEPVVSYWYGGNGYLRFDNVSYPELRWFRF